MNPIKTPNEMLLELSGIPHYKKGRSVSVGRVEGKPYLNPTPQELDAFVKERYPDIYMMPPKYRRPEALTLFKKNEVSQFGTDDQKRYLKWERENPVGLGVVDPQKVLNPINYYRPDPSNQFKGNTGLETQKSQLDADNVKNLILAMRAGKEAGVPQLTPQQLKAQFAVEGRSDFGFNGLDYMDRKALKIAHDLIGQGYDPHAAYTAGALYNKNQVAQRMGQPLQQVWNGTGPKAESYYRRYQSYLPLVEKEPNAQFNQVVNEAYQAPLLDNQPQRQVTPVQAQPEQQVDQLQQTPGLGAYKKGGKVSANDMLHELLANGKAPSKLKPKK